MHPLDQVHFLWGTAGEGGGSDYLWVSDWLQGHITDTDQNLATSSCHPGTPAGTRINLRGHVPHSNIGTTECIKSPMQDKHPNGFHAIKLFN